jgi:uncharacterized protein YeaO (DUF488 family)
MSSRKARILLKRAYEEPSVADGRRVLVERLWPRGLNKEKAAIDLWLKEVAPSTELRRWFGHDPRKWAEFRTRYRAELEDKGDAITTRRERLKEGPVTFLFAAKDEEHNSALALKEYLERRAK